MALGVFRVVKVAENIKRETEEMTYYKPQNTSHKDILGDGPAMLRFLTGWALTCARNEDASIHVRAMRKRVCSCM